MAHPADFSDDDTTRAFKTVFSVSSSGEDLLDQRGFDTALARRLHRGGLLELHGLIQVLNACRRGKLPTLARALVEQGALEADQVRQLLKQISTSSSSSGVVSSLGAVYPDAHRHTTVRPNSGEGAASAVLEGDPWFAGCDVGPYRLLRRVGLGGMGVVFQAQHRETGQIVALKTFRLDADPDLKARFQRELEAQQRLLHPNLVPVLDRGRHEGRPWFVMEFAEGGDLSQRLREVTRLDAREAARICRDLARGLEHMHDQGVLHRDIKPGNVLFDAAGTPKLVDLGIAKLEGAETLTISGDLLGTPAFMSPEQALGRRESIGPRSDVYSLGVLLFTMLTGRVPFQANSPMQLVTTVVTSPAPDPREFEEDIPDEIAELCLQLLEKEADDRLSARELGVRLDRILHGEKAEPTPGSAGGGGPRAAVLGGILLGVGIGVFVATGLGRGEVSSDAPQVPEPVVGVSDPVAPSAPGFPFDLSTGPMGRYTLQRNSTMEWVQWEGEVTHVTIQCELDLLLDVSEVRGTSARVRATIEGLRLEWDFTSKTFPMQLEPVRFDSAAEDTPPGHPLLRAVGKSFEFSFDLRDGRVDDVSGSEEIQAAINHDLSREDVMRYRIGLLQSTVLHAVLETLLHVLPGDAQLPEAWVMPRSFVQTMWGGGGDRSQGPTLEVPEIEVRYRREAVAPRGWLVVTGSGEGHASEDDVRWKPLTSRSGGELEFDLTSGQEQTSRLSWSNGRLETARFVQQWRRERDYVLTGGRGGGTEGHAVSFGADELSLSRIGD